VLYAQGLQMIADLKYGYQVTAPPNFVVPVVHNANIDLKLLEEELTCHIEFARYKDAYIVDDGFTYNKAAINKWLQQKNTTPETRAVCQVLLPNKNVQAIIQQITDEKLTLDGVLANLKCPLSGKIMFNPVVAEDGYSYEDEVLRDWLQLGGRISPRSQMLLSNKIKKIKNLRLHNIIEILLKYFGALVKLDDIYIPKDLAGVFYYACARNDVATIQLMLNKTPRLFWRGMQDNFLLRLMHPRAFDKLQKIISPYNLQHYNHSSNVVGQWYATAIKMFGEKGGKLIGSCLRWNAEDYHQQIWQGTIDDNLLVVKETLNIAGYPQKFNTIGMLPIHLAADLKNALILGELKKYGDINALDAFGDTAAHRVIKRLYKDALSMLLMLGADMSKCNRDGLTAVQLAQKVASPDLAAIIENFTMQQKLPIQFTDNDVKIDFKKTPADLQVMFLGSAKAGKSWLLSRLLDAQFAGVNCQENNNNCKSKIKTIIWNNTKKLMVFWDANITDRERIKIIDDINLFCVCFDVTQKNALNEVSEWLAWLIANTNASRKIILLGTKADNVDREVSTAMAMQKQAALLDKGVMFYYDCSALTGLNAKQIMRSIVQLGLQSSKQCDYTAFLQHYSFLKPPRNLWYEESFFQVPAYRIEPLKVLLMGPPLVGKSSLMHQFVNHTTKFEYNWYTERAAKKLQVGALEVQLDIYDSNGFELNHVYQNLLKDTKVVLLCMDLTNVEKWYARLDGFCGKIDNYAEKHAAIVLVGTKLDLKVERKITINLVQSVMASKRFDAYIECSAMTSEHIEEVFKLGVALWQQKQTLRYQQLKQNGAKVEQPFLLSKLQSL
jgi:small GTP-binding protein